MESSQQPSPTQDKENTHTDTQRLRTLTEKGNEQYLSKLSNLSSTYNKTWNKVNKTVAVINQVKNNDVIQLRKSEKQLRREFEELKSEFHKLSDFLSQTNSQQSIDELQAQSQIYSNRETEINKAFDIIDQRMEDGLETASQRSFSSRKSSNSNQSCTAILIQKQSELQAARTRAEYSTKKANIAKKKADLDLELELLNSQGDVAAAEAELQVLQSSFVDIEHEQSVNEIRLPTSNPQSRINEFLNQHNTNSPPIQTDIVNPTSSQSHQPPQDSNMDAYKTFNYPQGCNPQAHAFYPSSQSAIANNNEQLVASNLTQFFVRKELLFSRMTHFTDKPEAYPVWKSNFSAITQEMNVNLREEIDLLVKWLGPQSSVQAASLRTSNIHDPERGLQRIWERLDDRYGSPEMIESSIKSRLQRFPKLTSRDNSKLYELSDILSEMESLKENPVYSTLFAYLDSSSGVNPILQKLPYGIQEKWTSHAVKYKKQFSVSFPPFSIFVEFIRDITKAKNDPSFIFESTQSPTNRKPMQSIRSHFTTKKTDMVFQQPLNKHQHTKSEKCPLHHVSHALNDCKGFLKKSVAERKQFLKENNICFRCCSSTNHISSTCKEIVKCKFCSSDRHPSALHIRNYSQLTVKDHDGEDVKEKPDPPSTLCTQICNNKFGGKSCAKIVLVKAYLKERPEVSFKMYAIIDDQSNVSLARSEFFDMLGINTDSKPYTLLSCNGQVSTEGRRAYNCVIQDLSGINLLDIPYLIECDNIPNNRNEIPCPEVAQHYPHLNEISEFIPNIDNEAKIMLLIGRDVPAAHHVQHQRLGPRDCPFAQKLPLGWVIIGESCLGKVHKPDIVSVSKTYLIDNKRSSIFEPCPNNFSITETAPPKIYPQLDTPSIFQTTPEDEKPGPSREDIKFLEIMKSEFKQNDKGVWTAPLPFREPRRRLPNNRHMALKRASHLDNNLRRNPVKKKHFTTFMEKIFENNYAKVAPKVGPSEEVWYLPIFGVYHPQKPDQIRGVFDSSAEYDDTSLNKVLIPGPDMTNSLLGILLRFRRELVAVTADVEQMFYCFLVNEEHRNFLRFFWYKDNNPDLQMIEYRMCVHVFGNCPSPAVATYGLQKAAYIGVPTFGQDTLDFVQRNFYVDDGVTSLPTTQEAIDLLKRTQESLLTGGNIRLHKIASNDPDVLKAFSKQDISKDLKDLDFAVDNLPCQRSLGLTWALSSDSFSFKVSTEEKPFTRRGVLSTINSIFDPLGFAAPVILEGKLLLRELIQTSNSWDEPLSPEHQERWEDWRDSLPLLQSLLIPRTYLSTSLSEALTHELHIFSDASERAIAASAYLRSTYKNGDQKVTFVLGKAKLSPNQGHTIPRLELCAAVLAIEISDILKDELEIDINLVKFYTDSRVVLGYLCNEKRRFVVFVANRVNRILKSSKPDQWNYVYTEDNPADCATRSLNCQALADSKWLSGPSFLLCKQNPANDPIVTKHPLITTENDADLKQPITVLSTTGVEPSLSTNRFTRFSKWTSLVRGVVQLKRLARRYHKSALAVSSPQIELDTEQFIIREVQREAFSQELECIKTKTDLPLNSPLQNLNPFLDESGILRIGGCLNHAVINWEEKHPIIIPRSHHIGILLIRHHHESIKHQGRHFTEGAIRSAGLWIIGAKRLITSVIYKCVPCRKLRGKAQYQQMADLPPDRLETSPPFSYVGLDVFGPWTIATRRTRGGQANSKRWAVLFTCLCIRAVHIEVIEEMSSSSFINAFRRFTAIRGPPKEIRSDRGSNFIGSTVPLNIQAVNIEDKQVQEFLLNKRIIWKFNAPHSSHMGGVWERMIGVARRILESILKDPQHSNLTHEVFVTLMAEVSAIINARPITSVSSDPQAPEILSPSALLTLKSSHVADTSPILDMASLYKSQWKRVQTLSDMFWKRWRSEYLQQLQVRRKWQSIRPNVREGDIVILKEKSSHRNDWPLGLVTRILPSTDSLVRKVELRVSSEGKTRVFTRPVTELVVLMESEDRVFSKGTFERL